jgi:TonB family protein
MGYQSLLFCPDEKTARTVTQVLSELEFSVEACTEPFAAVKKLMGEHFDAVVVDCDNEQNAMLLFKSARNSAANQASLAVAVVEGQAGVAKAFRIGANLVLTKPINVEQAKGTLRVARGLLRKGDPAKPNAPAASTPAPTRTVSAAPPTAPLRPVTQVLGNEIPSQPWQPAAAAQEASAAVASSASAAHAQLQREDEAPAEPSLDSSPIAPPQFKEPPAPRISKPAATFPVPQSPKVQAPGSISTPHSSGSPAASASVFGTGISGAASAPAPARSSQESTTHAEIPKVTTEANAAFDKPAESGKIEPASPVDASPLMFGGASPAEQSSRSKKVLIAVAAIVVVAAGLYFGWTQLHGNATSIQGQPTTAAPAPVSAPQPSTLQTTSPSAQSPSPASAPLSNAQTSSQVKASPQQTGGTSASEFGQQPTEKGSALGPKSSAKPADSVPAGKPLAQESTPTAAPIVVKNGAAIPVQSNTATPDAPAPNVLVATAGSGGSLPNLISNPGSSATPVLQTLNVSQGVSQGLLIKKVQPIYPSNALHMHVEGAVQLSATIGKSGNITAVKIISGEPMLAKAALDAVKQWKYRPYFLNNEPVEIQTQVTVNFKLPR